MTRIINSNSGWSKRFLKQNAFSTYSWKFLRSRITRIQLGKSFNIALALINLIYQTEMTQAPANVKKKPDTVYRVWLASPVLWLSSELKAQRRWKFSKTIIRRVLLVQHKNKWCNVQIRTKYKLNLKHPLAKFNGQISVRGEV